MASLISMHGGSSSQLVTACFFISKTDLTALVNDSFWPVSAGRTGVLQLQALRHYPDQSHREGLGNKHRSSFKAPRTKVSESLVGAFQRIGVNRRVHRNLRCEREEFDGVLTREIRHTL
jgi:hypothetical protein